MRPAFRSPRLWLRLGAATVLLAIAINTYVLLGLACLVYFTLVVLFLVAGWKVPTFASVPIGAVAGSLAISPSLLYPIEIYVLPECHDWLSLVSAWASYPLFVGYQLDENADWLGSFPGVPVWTAYPKAIVLFWLGLAVAIGTSAAWRLVQNRSATCKSGVGPALRSEIAGPSSPIVSDAVAARDLIMPTLGLPRFSLRMLGAAITLIALAIHAYCLLGLGCFLYIALVASFFLTGLWAPSAVGLSLSVIAGFFAMSPWLFGIFPQYISPDSPNSVRWVSLVIVLADVPLSLGIDLDSDIWELVSYSGEGPRYSRPEAIVAFWLGLAVAVGTPSARRSVRERSAGFPSERRRAN